MTAPLEGRVDAVEVEDVPAAVGGHRDLDDLAAEAAGHGEERHVGGGRQDHRAARPGEDRDRRRQAGDHVGQRPDPGRVHVPAVAVALPRRRTRPPARPTRGSLRYPKSARLMHVEQRRLDRRAPRRSPSRPRTRRSRPGRPASTSGCREPAARRRWSGRRSRRTCHDTCYRGGRGAGLSRCNGNRRGQARPARAGGRPGDDLVLGERA